MKTYNKSQIASITGVHPNTVRLYEKSNPPLKHQSFEV